jgi:Ni2+-binding GTPase involved in maturation of urease and hydrogenase
MARVRYILIGGFLGAGKTTAILNLARRLDAQGLRVGLITNDQNIDLVDTARATAGGHAVKEITGGCFCCKFDSLVEASRQLMEGAPTDMLIAEPVGSCTDILATVGYPLRQMYGHDYRISPLSVMVDPRRCAGVLDLDPRKQFSRKVIYVYRKQLEEAEIIAVNKIDLLDKDARERLVTALAKAFPHAELHQVSCKSGAGLDAWFDRITTGELGDRIAMDVDYDEYAEGEALLGWLNARGRVAAARGAGGDFDGNALLIELADRLKQRIDAYGVEIAHLKMTLAPSEGPDLASVSLTSNGESPQPTHRLQSPLDRGALMVNLRAEADPELLEREVLKALKSLGPVRFELEHLAAFRPGRPSPTHRVSAPPE